MIAFNTVFAQHMSTDKVNSEQLTAFAAADNEAARKTVLAKVIGFDPVDAGPLRNARSLEPLAFLNIQLSWALDNGPNVGVSSEGSRLTDSAVKFVLRCSPVQGAASGCSGPVTANCARSDSTRLRFTPKSEYPSRAAERT